LDTGGVGRHSFKERYGISSTAFVLDVGRASLGVSFGLIGPFLGPFGWAFLDGFVLHLAGSGRVLFTEHTRLLFLPFCSLAVDDAANAVYKPVNACLFKAGGLAFLGVFLGGEQLRSSVIGVSLFHSQELTMVETYLALHRRKFFFLLLLNSASIVPTCVCVYRG